MKTRSVSKREASIIEEIQHRDMLTFTPTDIRRFTDLEQQSVYNLLVRMEDKGHIERVEQGRYILKEDLETHDIYEIAASIIRASYLGLLSALHFHGMTAQIPQKIQIMTTRRKQDITLQGRDITFITIDPKQFFGYQEYNGTVASTPEKTIIDALRLPTMIGNMTRIENALSPDLDIERLLRYCRQTDSTAVAARLGYLLETNDIPFDMAALKTMITHYTRLDPTRPQSNPDADWKLYVNRDL